jgi:hypothetical protein
MPNLNCDPTNCPVLMFADAGISFHQARADAQLRHPDEAWRFAETLRGQPPLTEGFPVVSVDQEAARLAISGEERALPHQQTVEALGATVRQTSEQCTKGPGKKFVVLGDIICRSAGLDMARSQPGVAHIEIPVRLKEAQRRIEYFKNLDR